MVHAVFENGNRALYYGPRRVFGWLAAIRRGRPRFNGCMNFMSKDKHYVCRGF